MGNCGSHDTEKAPSEPAPLAKDDPTPSATAPASKKQAPEPEQNKMDELPDDPIIGTYLKNVPLLSKLTDTERSKLGGALIEKKFKEGEAIITQDEVGREFYIIRSGKAKVSRSDESGDITAIADLSEGDYFGEAALLTNEKRAATITATEATVCLSLDADTFSKLFSKHKLNVQFAKRNAVSAEQLRKAAGPTRPENIVQEKSDNAKNVIKKALSQNVLFSNLDTEQQDQIVAEMYLMEVEAGVEVIKQGDMGDNFYVVEKGEFEVLIAKDGAKATVVATRGTATSFGELALMYNSPRAASVRSKTKAVLWAVDRYTFRRILMKVSSDKLQEYESFLKSVPLLASLISSERAKVAEALEEVSYKKGDVIVEQGAEGDTFFVLRRGSVNVTIHGEDGAESEVSKLNKGDFFGERALIKQEPRAATVTAAEDVECLVLDRQGFSMLLGPLTSIMERNIEQYNASPEGDEAAKPVIDSPLLDIKREDLEVIGTLGKGSFGHVQLVRDRNTGETYALKQVNKSQIVQLGQQDHIMSEKNVMASLNHPFLIRLRSTFKDKNYLYFLLELCLGGELFSVLRSRIVFDERTAKFFAASVVLSFEYMHDRNIIYRDLKPENLLLDNDGFLKVTDFGFAKEVTDRTWTLCGTPDYLAPEVVSGQGHGKGVDWWTLGVLIYEMLASYPPFYDVGQDPMKTYAKIMHGAITFPKHFSKESVDLIQRLLHPKPTKRLGVVKGGAKLIKKHPWFKGFDWDALIEKKMKAPIVPKIKNAIDMSNFEEYPEEEDEFPPYQDDGTNWEADF